MSYALGKDMRRSSIATSAMLHATVLILVTISFPWLQKKYEEPPPMQVELVDIADMSQTTKLAPHPTKTEDKPKPPKPEPPKEEPKKPQPAATHTLKPEPSVLKPPEKEEKKEEKVEKTDEMAVPKKEKQPEKKPVKKEEVKKNTEEDFNKLLVNLAKTKPLPTPATPAIPKESDAKPDGQPLPIGERMTMTEMDALRKQLEGCWNVPAGARDAENTTVDIFMVINQDRTLQSAQIVDTSRYNSDTFFRAMADSALRAVRNPNCSPFDLPPDKYESWKTVTVTFDASQMF